MENEFVELRQQQRQAVQDAATGMGEGMKKYLMYAGAAYAVWWVLKRR